MNLSVSQALAMGLPVILTDHSGLPDQVVDGENGYLAKEADPEDIAKKIQLFFDAHTEWERLSEYSRAHAKKHYDNQSLMKRQVDIYHTLIEKSQAK